MSRKELHELLDMVLDIGTSSKYYTNLDYRNRPDSNISASVYVFTHENGNSTGIVAQLDINALGDAARAWLNAWKIILEKEREQDATD